MGKTHTMGKTQNESVAGPLLYHYADMPGEFSIELSWEDVRRIAEEDVGFEILVR